MKILKEENKVMVADQEIMKKIYEYEKLKAEIEPLEKELKEEILYAVNSGEHNDGIYLSPNVQFSITKGSVKRIIDSKKLKTELPEVFEKYSKESFTKEFVKLTFI